MLTYMISTGAEISYKDNETLKSNEQYKYQVPSRSVVLVGRITCHMLKPLASSQSWFD